MKQSARELHQAVIDQNLRKINQLYKQGDFDVNAQDDQGHTPLFIAAFNGYIGVVRVLLLYKADHMVGCGSDNATPLHAAAQNGHVAVVEELLKAGANPGIQDNEGRTALFYAIKADHVNLVRILWCSLYQRSCIVGLELALGLGLFGGGISLTIKPSLISDLSGDDGQIMASMMIVLSVVVAIHVVSLEQHDPKRGSELMHDF